MKKRTQKPAAARRNKHAQQQLQIIGGSHRHRKIDFVAVDDLRPTGARLRETLFNWLQPDIYGTTCLDLFAGSGILGFEALSRGAQSVTFVEKHPLVAKQLEKQLTMLGMDNGRVVNADARAVLKSLAEGVDIIFLDPPYSLRCLPEFLTAVLALKPRYVFIEDDKPFEAWVKTDGDYEIVKSKKAGNIYYGLLAPVVT